MCTSKDSQYPESLRKFKLELQWNVILCTKAVKTKLSRQQFIGREREREKLEVSGTAGRLVKWYLLCRKPTVNIPVQVGAWWGSAHKPLPLFQEPLTVDGY